MLKNLYDKNMEIQKASTEEELLEKMNSREFYILITDELNEKVQKLLRTTLSDEELMGVELGSAGTLSLLAEIIYKIISTFNGKSKLDRQLENKIRQYKYKIVDKQILLYLRQVDY